MPNDNPASLSVTVTSPTYYISDRDDLLLIDRDYTTPPWVVTVDAPLAFEEQQPVVYS